jgi:TusA-related sulfurtransferase
MAELPPGEALLVMATDAEAPIDLAAWAADEGHGFREVAPGEFELVKRRRSTG